MLPSPRFSVASAFVPHLCFLSLLCCVRYLCYVCILLAPISLSLFSICSNSSLYLTLLPLFFFEFPCLPCVLCLYAFSLYSVFSPISLFHLTIPCVLKRFPLTTSRKTTTTCAKNVLIRTPGDTEHDVLPLTPTPEFPSQDKPGRWRGHGGMVAHDLVNGCQATA